MRIGFGFGHFTDRSRLCHQHMRQSEADPFIPPPMEVECRRAPPDFTRRAPHSAVNPVDGVDVTSLLRTLAFGRLGIGREEAPASSTATRRDLEDRAAEGNAREPAGTGAAPDCIVRGFATSYTGCAVGL